ncbi:class I SAM-dependent methyltransferase [Aquipuribacter sp. SD81]|uniref:class I SAM-dependent methyltransferase n=1 Tax=Aquipuribacter sp. SD81 TaxID=3127703 RepID=UPI00301A5AD2
MSPLAGAGPTGGPADGPAGWATTWLDLRGEADSRSRSAELLTTAFAAARAARPGPAPADGVPLRVVDVGCGAGAMARWVVTRADGVPTRWVLLDPDPSLLRVGRGRLADAGATVDAVRVGTSDDLPDLLGGEHAVDLVVASALLDVLPGPAVARLASAVVAAGVPLLCALTVTGEVVLDPPDPVDALARDCVARTATTGGALGPGAADTLVAAASAAGAGVRSRATPWRLDPTRDADLLRAWWDGHAAAARHGAGPEERSTVEAWARRRDTAVAVGGLRVVVAHTDVLLLPVPWAGR